MDSTCVHVREFVRVCARAFVYMWRTGANQKDSNLRARKTGSLSFNIGLDSRPVMLCKVNAICLANRTPPSREPAQTQNSARVILHSSAPDVGKRKTSGAGF
uniref:Uncharacterized protein n=1 Tax=Glossina austeni TaxID=7395 RepID=A0A1A9UL45_GLOAU